MSLEERINQVRHTLGTVEALLVQAEENLKGCQQTQQTRLELAKAQIEYRLVKNQTETLQNQMETQELTRKQQASEIKAVDTRLNQLYNDIAALTRQKVSMHRGLRIVSTAPTGARSFGQMRRRGRIFGCLPGAAGPGGECESSCGLTDRKAAIGSPSSEFRTICYTVLGAGGTLTSVTLNLAAAASVVVMAAVVHASNAAGWQIQRGGVNRTDQSVSNKFGKTASCGDAYPSLAHYEACESLAAGAYTWSLVNTSGGANNIYAYWMKAREITCLPV